ncbi:hypothetical protein BDR26DRAFT_897928 [Obelidium mucronatum]|nr:hypothetical protein BDR26DRAFT_897928 [Obelidium mucronatum]
MSHTSSVSSSSSNLLENIMQASASFNDHANYEEVEVFQPSLMLEDPDLMPTMEDWALVYSYVRDGEGPQLLALVDPTRFLEEFFFLPPALRLSICAKAAYLKRNTLPENLYFGYYEKAKKAIWRYLGTPNLMMIQTFVSLASFATMAFRDMYTALPLFQKAVGMMLQLRLDVDPDISPWLFHLNLTEAEKEDRRIAYWVIYFALKRGQIALKAPLPPLQNTVKFAKQISQPKQPLLNTPQAARPIATVCYLCAMLDIVQDTKMHHLNIPTSALDILISPTTIQLAGRLNSLREQIPSTLLLSPTNNTLHEFLSNPIHPTSAYYMGSTSLMDTLMTTMLYNSAQCVLFRPQLYLTGFLEVTSPALLNKPSNLALLLTVLEKCVTSARTISGLNSWVLSLPNEIADSLKLRTSFFMEHYFTYFALFEAAVVLWFVTCKSKVFWWRIEDSGGGGGDAGAEDNTLRMNLEDRKRIRSEVLDLLKTLTALDEMNGAKAGGAGKLTSLIAPLRKCVTAMVFEMEKKEIELAASLAMNTASSSPSSHAVNIEDVVIGLEIMGLADNTETNPAELRTEEPWVFLGLLGACIDGSMRWTSPKEKDWEQLWNQHIR